MEGWQGRRAEADSVDADAAAAAAAAGRAERSEGGGQVVRLACCR